MCHAGSASSKSSSPEVFGFGAFGFLGRSRPVSRVLSWTVIPLGAASPLRSSNLPGDTAGRGIASLFGLAPGGVCRAGPLPDSRCALTAPFHPCRPACAVLGGIFLLHFPSARAAQALPGTVPCGARTFLGTLASDATVWPAPPRALSHATGGARTAHSACERRQSPSRKTHRQHHQPRRQLQPQQRGEGAQHSRHVAHTAHGGGPQRIVERRQQ